MKKLITISKWKGRSDWSLKAGGGRKERLGRPKAKNNQS